MRHSCHGEIVAQHVGPLLSLPVAQEDAVICLATGVPVMFGVLTTENIEQAIERAGTKSSNKGFDCASGATEMVNLCHAMEGREALETIGGQNS